eukprot:snap_masked-scaffold_3-processed-gene-21.78-mRNA-1 protein AED:1.00 eAED:1.00 QI:0/-1/0/0/-1/1/1/0/125
MYDSLNVDGAVLDTKQLMANERTYVEWIQMAVTIGGISLALLSLDSSKELNQDKLWKENYIGMILLPLGVVYALYGMWIYLIRRNKIIEHVRDLQRDRKLHENVASILGACTAGGLCLIISINFL